VPRSEVNFLTQLLDSWVLVLFLFLVLSMSSTNDLDASLSESAQAKRERKLQKRRERESDRSASETAEQREERLPLSLQLSRQPVCPSCVVVCPLSLQLSRQPLCTVPRVLYWAWPLSLSAASLSLCCLVFRLQPFPFNLKKLYSFDMQYRTRSSGSPQICPA
jgi:hypothetical protein